MNLAETPTDPIQSEAMRAVLLEAINILIPNTLEAAALFRTLIGKCHLALSAVSLDLDHDRRCHGIENWTVDIQVNASVL
jgi:hypothetical protein